MEWQESVDNAANPCLDQAEKFAEVIALFLCEAKIPCLLGSLTSP